jgi:hypothetical protein
MKTYTVEQAENILNARPEVKSNFAGKVSGIRVLSVSEITDKNGYDKCIINLNLSSTYQLDRAFDQLREGDVQGALNSNLTCTFLLPTSRYIPSKGDIVDVIIEQAPRKDGGTFAKPTSVVEMKAQETISKKRSVAVADEAETEEAETIEEAIGKKK